MAETLNFELVSPERLLISQAVEMVIVPGEEGDFGALPRHAPMITAVRPGVIDIYQNGVVVDRIFVSGGFAEVNETSLTVLAEEAANLNELTEEMISAHIAAAETATEEADSEAARANAARTTRIAQAMRAAFGEKV